MHEVSAADARVWLGYKVVSIDDLALRTDFGSVPKGFTALTDTTGRVRWRLNSVEDFCAWLDSQKRYAPGAGEAVRAEHAHQMLSDSDPFRPL